MRRTLIDPARARAARLPQYRRGFEADPTTHQIALRVLKRLKTNNGPEHLPVDAVGLAVILADLVDTIQADDTYSKRL